MILKVVECSMQFKFFEMYLKGISNRSFFTKIMYV